jgi:Fe-S-cluster containining protein
MDARIVTVDAKESFHFSCLKENACFGVCCRNLNQFLTPYDILKMKQGLNLSSTQFLAQYTVGHTGPRSGLPVVSLRFDPRENGACPFLASSGCRVYANRPTACRLYPLARAVSRNRETVRTSEHFALIREPFCRGFEEGQQWTAEAWLQDQEARPYLCMNDRLLDLIALKNRFWPGGLPPEHRHFFILVLYDLDRFRIEAGQGGLEAHMDEEEAVLAASMDDTALLTRGHRWVARVLSAPARKGIRGKDRKTP